ncbi:MAG TPA: LptF/LptG family permease, partial [Calditrichaeota bacterium]|nr:LptF/LptG family permease [Calditrichota bacterium]
EEWLDLSNLLGPEYYNVKQLDKLRDLAIFDRSSIGKDITILAKEGYMIYSKKYKALIFTLFNGEYHELDTKNMEDYQRSLFQKQVVYIPAKEFDFEEKKSDYRSDREMNIKMMQERIDDFRFQVARQKDKVAKNITSFFQKTKQLLNGNKTVLRDSVPIPVVPKEQWSNAARRALTVAKRREQQMKTSQSYIENHYQSINKYSVEIYKKISIPFASIVFILIGAPLGIMTRKGSMGVAISLSIGFFLLYWAFLISGEDLADRRIVSPMLAMWAANIVVGFFGILLIWRAVKENTTINRDRLAYVFKFRWLKINNKG